ncbi:MAG TPA: hypothetical protein VNT01_12090, partial [Symbiobacteriaceae bacterium]|nr:hypothetical protein [Symbiobacteriaceae bacterium]
LADRERSLLLKLRKQTIEPVSAFEALPPEVVDQFSTEQRIAYIRGLVKEVTVYPDGDVKMAPREKPRLPA